MFAGNYGGIAKSVGFFAVREYRYWDAERYCIDIDGMIEDLTVGIIIKDVYVQSLSAMH